MPEKHGLKPEALYFVTGYPAKRADFRFDHSQPIFTDGSAKNVQWPEIAVASSACFQIGNVGLHRVIAAQLPPEFPISAVSSEFYAFALAADVLPIEGLVPPMLSDCQAVA